MTSAEPRTSPLEIAASAAGEGSAYWFLNALSVVRISSKQTGGAFALVEETLPPGRSSPFHVHQYEDESFYVLEGVLTFFSEGSKKIVAREGSTIFLPRKRPHGFRSETAAKILIMTTPGGFDEFVAEAGEVATERELPPPSVPDVAQLTATAKKYGIDILGPLPL